MIGADEVFEIINDALFKMTWLNQLIGTGLMGIGVDTTSQVGASVLFFCYDTVKIAILLVAVIFIIGYIQSYFPPERTKKLLGHLHGIWANIVGALMGTITPFCACNGKDVIAIVQTQEVHEVYKDGFPVGRKVSFAFDGNVVHLFSKEGTEKNLEF